MKMIQIQSLESQTDQFENGGHTILTNWWILTKSNILWSCITEISMQAYDQISDIE